MILGMLILEFFLFAAIFLAMWHSDRKSETIIQINKTAFDNLVKRLEKTEFEANALLRNALEKDRIIANLKREIASTNERASDTAYLVVTDDPFDSL